MARKHFRIYIYTPCEGYNPKTWDSSPGVQAPALSSLYYLKKLMCASNNNIINITLFAQYSPGKYLPRATYHLNISVIKFD